VWRDYLRNGGGLNRLGGCVVRCGICISSNKGFGSLGIFSGINFMLLCSVCMYSYSVGGRRVCLSIPFSNVIVSSMFPYSCLLLSMCRAYDTE
jgi:hypothetical protein